MRSSRSCSAIASRRCGRRTSATSPGSAITGAAVVAIAAVALRSIEIPRILGPALLVLVFFLWDAIHVGDAVAPARSVAALGDRALAALAVVVIGWSLGIRA